ncbi:hypothetical protein ACFLW8_02255 [Chloroflexota bacterium]
MNYLKSIVNASHWIFSAVMMLVGLGVIILAFMNSPLQLQFALGLIGLGFISLGLVQLRRIQSEKRIDQILAKLDEIQQEIKKEEPPERTNTDIANIITSGLKFYADHIIANQEEK